MINTYVNLELSCFLPEDKIERYNLEGEFEMEVYLRLGDKLVIEAYSRIENNNFTREFEFIPKKFLKTKEIIGKVIQILEPNSYLIEDCKDFKLRKCSISDKYQGKIILNIAFV